MYSRSRSRRRDVTAPRSRVAQVCQLLNVVEVAYRVVGAIANLIASKRTGRLQDSADIEVPEALQRLRTNG